MKKSILFAITLLFILGLSACENTFVVTFNVQEDTLFYEAECIENERLDFPEDPSIDGYTFEGWYTSSAYLVEVDNNQTCTSNFTFYGKLTPTNSDNPTNTDSFVIEFVDYDGTILGTYSFDAGADTSSLTIPSTPLRDDYTFSGWTRTVPTTMPENNVTITALYTQNVSLNMYTVTYLDTDRNIIQTDELKAGDATSGITVPEIPTGLGFTAIDWNQNLPSVMPSENLTIEPIYYSTYSFTKELGNINEHAYYIQGDYIIYMVNNWNWSIEESERDNSTVNILKISDPEYHRVIEIDKANGYAYNLVIQDNRIIVSSPYKDNGVGTGVIYFFDLVDTSYSYSISKNFSNVHGFGTSLAINEDGTQLLVGYNEYVATTDSYYDQFYMLDISTSIPSVTGAISDTHVSEHPWEMGGIAYGDFYVITKDLSTDIIVEVRKFSDSNYIKSFSLNTELANLGLSTIDSYTYYQTIQEGLHSNPLSVSGNDMYYTVDLTVADPSLTIYQRSDIPNAGTGYIIDFLTIESNTYTIFGAKFYDGTTGTSTNSIVIEDGLGNVVKIINEEYISINTVNNVLIISTSDYDSNMVSVYLYDTSDASSLELISIESHISEQAPIIASDGTNYMMLFTDYSLEETFIYIDVENLID